MKAKKSPPLDIPGPSPATASVSQTEVVATEAMAEGINSPEGADSRAFEIPIETLDIPPESFAAPEQPERAPLKLSLSDDDTLPNLSGQDSAATTTLTVESALAVKRPNGWPIYIAATLVSALWAMAPIMFAWGYRREVAPFQNDLFALVVFVLLAVGPAALVWIAAYLLHQGLRLAAEMRRAQALADTMVQPAALAARGAGAAVESVRREIEHATAFAADARAELLALRDVIAAESERLIESAQGSNRTAQALTLSLGEEREKMAELADALDTQAAGVIDAIARHARMVGEASDLAETQIREAEAALAARAADLAAAAGEASDAARMAGEDLSRQTARLETAGLGVGDQMKTVEEGLAQQRAALVTTAHGMRADHEVFAAQAETYLAQLNEIITQIRQGSGELGTQAVENAEVLRRLIASAAENLRELTQGAAHERDAFGTTAAQSLGAFAQVALAEREDLERHTREVIERLAAAGAEASRSAAQQAEIARHRVDQLSEAAFAAAQKAEAVFESRLEDARGLIQQSVQLVAEAGDQSSSKFGETLASARATLSELDKLLNEINERAASLPIEAHTRAESVRQSLERGIEHLMASARKAAEETQTIDAAFQERVRRNYDMLSEAVRLMGVVSGTASATPTARVPSRQAKLERTAGLNTRFGESPASSRPGVREDAGRWAQPASPTAESMGLRTRLKLTPTASDEEFKTVFEAAGGREPPDSGEDSWTWKELLSSMEPAPAEDNASANTAGDSLLNDIDAMGIDAGALLPRGRIEQIAGAVRGREPGGASALVRRLAPAAIRRLSRRIMSDPAFQTQAEQFARRYGELIDDAIDGGASTGVVSSLLGSDQGRAYLLIDAAQSEAG